MPNQLVKFSGQMDSRAKAELDKYVRDSGMTFSAVYTDMVRHYLNSRRLRPVVALATEEVLREDSELLARLAK